MKKCQTSYQTMNKSPYILREFRFTPYKNLEPYMAVGKYTLYSNENLIKYSIDNITKNKNISPILSETITNIEQNKILIGYFNSNIFNFLYRKFNGKEGGIPGVIGLYDPDTKRVLIILDNNVTITGKTLYNISDTIIHELCHATAHQYPNDFISSTYNNYLLKYYSFFIDNFSEVYIKEDFTYTQNSLKKLILELFKKCDIGDEKTKVVKAGALWRMFFKENLKNMSEMTNTNISKITLPYIHYLNNINISFDEKKDAEKISNILYKTYTSSFNKNIINTIAAQEVNTPSEIVAVANQNDLNNNISNLLKKF